MKQLDRRSFLKGLAGTAIAGSYVLTNPIVVAGDLLVPNPEPTIIKASEPLQQVHGPIEAMVVSADWNIMYDEVVKLELRLEVLGPLEANVPMWPLGKVRLYPVKDGQA